jgi:hypothetical protein
MRSVIPTSSSCCVAKRLLINSLSGHRRLRVCGAVNAQRLIVARAAVRWCPSRGYSGLSRRGVGVVAVVTVGVVALPLAFGITSGLGATARRRRNRRRDRGRTEARHHGAAQVHVVNISDAASAGGPTASPRKYLYIGLDGRCARMVVADGGAA